MNLSPCSFAIVGMSTGGPKTLGPLFAGMPVLNGSIILIQHMPQFINENIVSVIAALSPMRVKLPANGEVMEQGTVYVAPSYLHLTLSANMVIVLSKGPKVNFCCPSIDVAMKSVRAEIGNARAGAIMTGMGSDGAQGLVHLKSLGATTLVQDEFSSTVFGMPKAAIETGCVDHILPPEKIREKLVEILGVRK